MSFLLAIFAIVFVDTLDLHVVAIKEFFQFLILLAVQDLFDFFDSLFELVVFISYDYDMKGFVVLEDVFGLLVSTSPPHSDLAARTLLYQLLGPSSGTDDLSNIVSLLVIDCIICQVDLFELFEGFVVAGWHESRVNNVVRLAHLHAVFYKRDTLSQEIISFAHFARVDTLALVVVDGFGAGRAQVWVFGDEVVHLGVQLVKPVQS